DSSHASSKPIEHRDAAAETRRCHQYCASEVLILSPSERGDPIGEGKILEKASKNSYFEVRMGIDEAGNDSAAGKPDGCGIETLTRRASGALALSQGHRDDVAVVDCE